MYYSIDFETFSEVDLTNAGLSVYARDESTGIYCMAYAEGDEGEPDIWLPHSDPFPEELIRHILDGGELRAFNASFEYAIFNYVAPLTDIFPDGVPAAQFHCTQARARVCGLPGSLRRLAEALEHA
jgi:DNA polymerase